ncbi:MAG TPA: carboxypeptidase-like regulatory domain-containing protein [Blastocatellia bacterium]|nr:carboxypeptidase-like regulatory domain-containing protein [Blastocatellia bacterium]
MRHVKNVTFILLILLNVDVVARPQTSAAATVSGTVSDAQGAVVAGAVITLIDTATNQGRTSTADDAGQYQFLAVQPGVYRISVTMPGFRQKFVRDVKVEVSRAYEVNIPLDVGQVTETVEVKVSAGTELQKFDATVGSVIGGVALKLLPSLSRDAAALLSLQPMVAPPGGGRGGRGGQVAGARVDQNTFMLLHRRIFPEEKNQESLSAL